MKALIFSLFLFLATVEAQTLWDSDYFGSYQPLEYSSEDKITDLFNHYEGYNIYQTNLFGNSELTGKIKIDYFGDIEIYTINEFGNFKKTGAIKPWTNNNKINKSSTPIWEQLWKK